MHGKKHPDAVPDKYFDAQLLSVMSQIEQTKQLSPSKKAVIIRRLHPILNIAASLLLLAILGFGLLFLRNNARQTALMEETYLEDYLFQYADHDRNLFYEMVIDTGAPDPNFAQLSEDYYLIEYLLETSELQGLEPEDLLIQPLVTHEP